MKLFAKLVSLKLLTTSFKSFILDIHLGSEYTFACSVSKSGWVPPCEKCLYSELFWSVFSALGLNMENYRVNLHIQSECGKIWTRKTSNTDTSHAVCSLGFKIVACQFQLFFFVFVLYSLFNVDLQQYLQYYKVRNNNVKKFI